MARNRKLVGQGSGVSAAFAAALPEKAALDAGMGMATRFWGGVIDSLGKVAIESTTVRVGRKRKPTVHTVRVFGQEKTIDRSGSTVLTTTHHEVARWELVPLFLVGSAAAAASLAATQRGMGLVAKAKGTKSYAKYEGWASATGKTKGQWGPFPYSIYNLPGGIHIPY